MLTSLGARATVYPFDHAQLKVDVGNALSADKKPTWLVVERRQCPHADRRPFGREERDARVRNFNGRSGLLFRIDNMGSVCIADVVRDSREVIIGPTPTTFTLSNFRKQGPGGPCTSVGGAPRIWERQVTLATVNQSGQLTMDVSLTGSTHRSKPLAYHVSSPVPNAGSGIAIISGCQRADVHEFVQPSDHAVVRLLQGEDHVPPHLCARRRGRRR